MKRRDFIRVSGLTAPIFVNGLSLNTLAKSRLFSAVDDDTDRVLVLIQLNGGNDGLNTLIPLDQYSQLVNLRNNIIIPENSVLEIDNELGFHPEMTGMKELYDQGLLKAVQSVAYPNQNRSHFRSTDIWTSASPAQEVWTTGWLGRYLQNRYADFPDGYPNTDCPDPFAITVGNLVSETCQGLAGNFSMAIQDAENLNPIAEGAEGTTPDTPYGHELTFLREAIKQTNKYSERITLAAGQGTNQAEYDENNRLSQALKTVAQLISGGLGTRIYVVSLGGFDTHANQVLGDATQGVHANLLSTLSDAIFSFQEDIQLQGLGERVLGLTFSEFGRQIAQNFSLGTDHGTAAPLFIFGNCVNPEILGTNPQIPDTIKPQEGVAIQHDFRDLYGSVLEDWFSVSAEEVRDILYPEYVKLPVLDQSCLPVSTNDPTIDPTWIDISVRPNPVRGTAWFDITMDRSEDLDLRIFDAVGKEIATVVSQRFEQGKHSVSYNCHRLPKGNYYYRLRAGNTHKTRLMQVI